MCSKKLGTVCILQPQRNCIVNRVLFFAWNLVIITFKFNFVFRQRSTPPLFCCEFDNERAPLVCCRDNVNKYANYTSSSMNLCGSLKFYSKPSLHWHVIRAYLCIRIFRSKEMMYKQTRIHVGKVSCRTLFMRL